MTHINFSFKLGVPDNIQEQLGQEFKEIPGVDTVRRNLPTAKSSVARSYWHARTIDEASAKRLVDALQGTEEIDSAGIPKERGLLI